MAGRLKPAPGPFDAFLGVFRGAAKVGAPDLTVERKNADVGLLDELASLDRQIALRQFERIETIYAEGGTPEPADVALYTASVQSVRASVAEKAKLLGSYGALAGKQDRDAVPTFRVIVNSMGGRLPAETGAEDVAETPDVEVSERKDEDG